jgi:glycosyltransferase involved in cell wall biosynthesis
VRLAVYTDYAYRKEGDVVYGERAFVHFLAGLSGSFERLVLLGRLNPEPGHSHYPLDTGIEFVALPHYDSLLRPGRAALALLGSMRAFWRTLDEVDAVWLLGPYIHSLAFVALARLRRRPVALGVRQDLPRYARTRHPGRRWTHIAASALDGTYRLLARRHPVIVVGPDLARRYRRAPRLLDVSVSLIGETDLITPEAALARPYDGELHALSVGRLDREKNPLLLADVLAALEPRWRLDVCGEGPLDGQLMDRLRALGVEQRAELLGYVPFGQSLMDVYRNSHALLHVSWTEGLPQVLHEAFAAGLPVVATAVGGVPEAVGDAALLIEPGDAGAAAAALARVAAEPLLRERLITAGLQRARRHTREAECANIVAFLTDAWPSAGAGAGSHPG